MVPFLVSWVGSVPGFFSFQSTKICLELKKDDEKITARVPDHDIYSLFFVILWIFLTNEKMIYRCH